MVELLFYTPQEVADLLKIKVTTVYDYIRSGRLRAARIGKGYRIARADLEAFVANATLPAPATRPLVYDLPKEPAFDHLRRVAEERVKYQVMEAEAWAELPAEARARLREGKKGE